MKQKARRRLLARAARLLRLLTASFLTPKVGTSTALVIPSVSPLAARCFLTPRPIGLRHWLRLLTTASHITWSMLRLVVSRRTAHEETLSLGFMPNQS